MVFQFAGGRHGSDWRMVPLVSFHIVSTKGFSSSDKKTFSLTLDAPYRNRGLTSLAHCTESETKHWRIAKICLSCLWMQRWTSHAERKRAETSSLQFREGFVDVDRISPVRCISCHESYTPIVKKNMVHAYWFKSTLARSQKVGAFQILRNVWRQWPVMGLKSTLARPQMSWNFPNSR
jgi:hypothetical protein